MCSSDLSSQSDAPASPRPETHPRSGNRRAFRGVVEAVLFLSIAVVTVREFVAEGFMISTGSMAPTLLGYHRRPECRSCGTAYPVGAAHELGLNQGADDLAAVSGAIPADGVRCPNCGLAEPDVRRWPVSEGDQLLVHKAAFAFRQPRRWEVVVFRNPRDSAQSYVKRVGGLPSEVISIRRGDLYADGRLCGKPLAVQQAMAIPVSVAASEPTDTAWQTRWTPDTAVLRRGGDFLFPPADAWQSVRYQHRRREGGRHRTSVPLTSVPDVDAVGVTDGRVWTDYAGSETRLTANGVLSDVDLAGLAAGSRDAQFLNAVRSLQELSRLTPVTDDYAYNREDADRTQFVVRDLMWSGTVRMDASSALRVRLLYGRQPFEAVLDREAGQCLLVTVGPGGETQTLAKASISDGVLDGPCDVVFSNFDRRLVLAIDGQPLTPPLTFGWTPLCEGRSSSPVQFSARGGRVDVGNVRLSRDVYLTPKRSEPVRLLSDEFFVLGDNSPVSVDSRVWSDPAVPESALLGKPFVVHLPSRRRGGDNGGTRVPDWGRMRFVR